jgi:IS5 family transposase
MERRMGMNSLADYAVSRTRNKATFLDGIEAMMQWQPIEKLLKKGLGRQDEPHRGAKSYPALLMFKVLLLQSWYELSDQETENALLDRISFSRFAGISLSEEVPDHTTICRFRNSLVSKGLLEKLLNEVNRQFSRQGKLLKRGIAVDASMVSSAARPRRHQEIEEIIVEDRKEEEQGTVEYAVTVKHSVDGEAAWSKKGNKYYYGYKVHAGVDIDRGIVLAAHVTAANESDTVELGKVLSKAKMPKCARVYADKGYPSESNSQKVRGHGLKNGIMNKAQRNHPLSFWAKVRNCQISRKRFIVERTFGTLKKWYGMSRARYLGIAKVQGQVLLNAIAFNMKSGLFIVVPT